MEDAGDTLHTQRKTLDSGYTFDLTNSYATGRQPVRFLAEGRDPSATVDSGFSGKPVSWVAGQELVGDDERCLTLAGLGWTSGPPSARPARPGTMASLHSYRRTASG
ncbi:MAG TPA: hypothetical protein VI248_17725 [Kineosporiaceae bacterium]